MWIFNKFLLLLGLISLQTQSINACITPLKGYTIEANSQKPLAFVAVQVSTTGQVTWSDSSGYFEVLVPCAGMEKLKLSAIGYTDQQLKVEMPVDTILFVQLYPSVFILEDITVQAIRPPDHALHTVIDSQMIGDHASSNLGNLLDNISGVSVLRNGNNITKPIVHGLYGNRLTLLNNGVAQSGQQWGNDHSPEIDPLTANSIQVLQGVNSLSYMGSNLGTVVKLSPSSIGRAEDWYLKGNYFFESNGWKNGLNLSMQHANPFFAWRINGTVQKGGDLRTRNYWLTNTGQQTASLSLQVERQWNARTHSTFYASTYSTTLGILRGSHIGNLTDLKEAFQRKEPFYTKPKFSYAIQAPKQQVRHHFIKLTTIHILKPQQLLRYTAALQINDRKEFDVRRGNRTKKPALSLGQWSYFLEGRYEQQVMAKWKLIAGAQFNLVDNTNRPETGVLPLIPDYIRHRLGAFVLAKKPWRRSLIELGLRYDYHYQDVATIRRDVSRDIVHYKNVFHTFNAAFSWSYAIASTTDLTFHSSYSTRNPEINELYSNGLHQGVSGIEEGATDLEVEQLAQARIVAKSTLFKQIDLEATGYYQYFDNYIYLQPQKEFRLTIRGAFPVFRYQQTRAHIYGFDLGGHWDIHTNWRLGTRYSYLRGADLSEGRPLINMPPNNWNSYLQYHLTPNWKLGKGRIQSLELQVQHQYVSEQVYLFEVQDFLPPPPAYNLLELSTAVTVRSKQLQMRLVFRIDNLLNVSYRDYLNRQRYFADAQGLNAVLSAQVTLLPTKKERRVLDKK